MGERTTERAKSQRAGAFERWCWRRLGSPSDIGRSDRSVLKKVGLECSLEGLRLGLKFRFFSHVVRGACSLENTDDGKAPRQEKGKTERGRDGWMASQTQRT